MASYSPIDCDLHDYIEIMCMYALPVRICTLDKKIDAVGITTKTDSKKQEWLIYHSNKKIHEIRLDNILSIQTLCANAPFDQVDFYN